MKRGRPPKRCPFWLTKRNKFQDNRDSQVTDDTISRNISVGTDNAGLQENHSTIDLQSTEHSHVNQIDQANISAIDGTDGLDLRGNQSSASLLYSEQIPTVNRNDQVTYDNVSVFIGTDDVGLRDSHSSASENSTEQSQTAKGNEQVTVDNESVTHETENVGLCDSSASLQSTEPSQTVNRNNQLALEGRPARIAKNLANKSISNAVVALQTTKIKYPSQYFSRRRLMEGDEHYSRRLQEQRQRDTVRRASEEEHEHVRRLEQQRQRDALRRSTEEVKEHTWRLEQQRQRNFIRRSAEEDEERARRLEQQRQRDALRRSTEEVEEHNLRLGQQRQRDALRRSTEGDEEHAQRLEHQRQRDVLRRSFEIEEDRARRIEEQRLRTATLRQNHRRNQIPSYKSAASNNVDYSSLGPFNVACVHCGALHFTGERVQNRISNNSFGDCCLHGRVEQLLPEFPNELVLLFLHRHRLEKQFHERIRSICASLAFSSFNVADDRTFNNKGVYTFTAGGHIYHKINMAAQPIENEQGETKGPRYGQMYFIDPETAVFERLNEPFNQGIDQDLMQLLDEMMRSQNPFSQAYMMMREVVTINNHQAAAVGIQPPKVHLVFAEREGDDLRRFNAPTNNEVAAVITLNADQSIPENEMLIQERGKNIITLKNTDSRVEPFTYPLFYPKGTFGFSVGLPLKTPYASRAHMTRMELAQYRVAFRPNLAQPLLTNPQTEGFDFRLIGFNALHFGGRLFQQYVVDTYIRVERDRIQWIKANQKKLLADQYAGVTHFLNELAERKNAVVGEKIILPSSFPGSSRFYAEHFEDAMAIIRRFGSPDFFITITCSPTWPELKEAALIELSDGSTIHQFAQERPDLVARVAKLKFDQIVEDIYKRQIFGKSSAYVYTVEFQKRGLPHLHLLVIMSQEDKIKRPEE